MGAGERGGATTQPPARRASEPMPSVRGEEDPARPGHSLPRTERSRDGARRRLPNGVSASPADRMAKTAPEDQKGAP